MVQLKLFRQTRVILLLVVTSLLVPLSLYKLAQTQRIVQAQTRQAFDMSSHGDSFNFGVGNGCSNVQKAEIQTDLKVLLELLKDPNTRQTCAWIRMRVSQMWPTWIQAIRGLEQKQDLSNRRKRKVLMYLGFLSKKANWGFAELQFKGGPLGELVVWSDLIASLYMLGHDVKVTTEFEELQQLLVVICQDNALKYRSGTPRSTKWARQTEYQHYFTANQSRTSTHKTCQQPDNIIYTDIIGLKHISADIPEPYEHYKCRLRILDSFGVHAAFNQKKYAESTGRTTFWGCLNLRLQQFYNMFPHTPDDTFLGFVVRSNLSNGDHLEKENVVLVYGKSTGYWKGKEAYISHFSKAGFSVHGTVEKKSEEIPSFVTKHEILHGGEFQLLLRRSKIFLGLGEPYEGPAALEAIANGAVFINPKIQPPLDYRKVGKPTERKIKSQNPYIEDFIGEPYAYTVDTRNGKDVNAAIQMVNKNNKFTAFRPYEFTEEGYIQRLNSYVEHQNFCDFKIQNWPPDSAVTLTIGEPGLSCKDTCWKNNMICEPSHFYRANITSVYKTHGVACASEMVETDIYYPAVNIETNQCILQGDELLFSCVGEKETLRRICPCRTYVKYQSALCKGCV